MSLSAGPGNSGCSSAPERGGVRAAGSGSSPPALASPLPSLAAALPQQGRVSAGHVSPAWGWDSFPCCPMCWLGPGCCLGVVLSTTPSMPPHPPQGRHGERTHRGEDVPVKAAHRVGLAAVGGLRWVSLVRVRVGVRVGGRRVQPPLLLLLLPLFPLLDPHQLHPALLPADDHCGRHRHGHGAGAERGAGSTRVPQAPLPCPGPAHPGPAAPSLPPPCLCQPPHILLVPSTDADTPGMSSQYPDTETVTPRALTPEAAPVT